MTELAEVGACVVDHVVSKPPSESASSPVVMHSNHESWDHPQQFGSGQAKQLSAHPSAECSRGALERQPRVPFAERWVGLKLTLRSSKV